MLCHTHPMTKIQCTSPLKAKLMLFQAFLISALVVGGLSAVIGLLINFKHSELQREIDSNESTLNTLSTTVTSNTNNLNTVLPAANYCSSITGLSPLSNLTLSSDPPATPSTNDEISEQVNAILTTLKNNGC